MVDIIADDIAGAEWLAGLPGYALRRAANVMMADLSERFAALGLRISNATVLLLIGGRRDMTSSEIGEILEIQRANMVPLLNGLEAMGLIRREPIDGKSRAIVLTDAGRERSMEVRRIIIEFEADLLARIPMQHREHLMPALQALIA